MPEYLAPGVYVEEIDMVPKPIPGVPTSTIDIVTARRLVAALRPVIEQEHPEWSCFHHSDPGVTLIELFAFVAEASLYRAGADWEQRRQAVLRAVSKLAVAAGVCATECGILTRPRYFAGRLLDAATLQAEQDYHREKLRRHNRHLHGVGIVSGLAVHVDATTDSNGGRIVIEPGYAIDECGTEVAVPARVQVALPPNGEAAFVSLRQWDRPCAQLPVRTDTADAGWIEEVCLFAIVANVLPPGLAIARLLRANGRWTIDATFIPPRTGTPVGCVDRGAAMPSSLEDATGAIAAEWQAAWNAHDMSRMAALLTPDVDFVNVLGSHWKGRAEVERVHAAMHAAQFHDSVWENHESQAQLLGPDHGLAHVRWSIRGDFDPDGTPRVPRSGRFSWLLLRDGAQWRIRAAQNTNIVKLSGA